MKSLIKNIAFVILTLGFFGAKAQSIDNYSLTRTAPPVTYNSIIGNGGIAITTSNSQAVSFMNNSGNNKKETNRSTAIPLGFDFVFNGVAYNNVRVSSDGFIDFNLNSTSTTTSNNSEINSTGSTNFRPVIAPLWDDLEMEALSNSSSDVYYKVDAINKKIIVEWDNMEHNSNPSSDDVNFQVILDGNYGVIEFNYGVMSASTNNWSYSCGLADLTVTNIVNTSTVKLQSAANATNTNTSTTNLNDLPAANSRLNFTPPTINTAAAITSTVPTITSATINWSAATTSFSTPFKYQLAYKESSSATWNTQDLFATTTLNLTGLSASTTYDVKVITWTEGSYVESAVSSFTTLSVPNPTSNDVITFSNQTIASIDLAWTDFAPGAIYSVSYSTNATSGFSVFNTTSSPSMTVSGLAANTTYYFQIIATLGGTSSTPLTGSDATDSFSGVVKTSERNMNWSSTNDWNSNGVPASVNTVIIAHTVNLNTNSSISELIVNSNGTLAIESSRTLTVNNDVVLNGNLEFRGGSVIINGNLTINSTGSIIFPNNSGTNGTLTVKGNITNLGSMDIRRSSSHYAALNFTGTANQTISGTGSFEIQTINVNKTGGAGSNEVYMQATNFESGPIDLNITSGILNYNTTSATTHTFNSMAISTNGLFYMDAANATVTVASTMTGGGTIQMVSGNLNSSSNSFNYNGTLKIDGGVFSVGTGSNDDLIFNNNSSLQVSGGSLHVHGQLRHNISSNVLNYNQTGGEVTLGVSTGNSTSYYALNMPNNGSVFTMSGGTLAIQNTNTSSLAIDWSGCSASTSSITGGTILLSNSNTGNNQTFILNNASNPLAINNLDVQTASSTVVLNQALTLNNLTCAGTFNANSKNIAVKGDWDISGTYTSGSNTTTFDGSANQSINQMNGSFNNLTLSNSNTTTAMSNLVATGAVIVDANSSLELGETTFTVGGNLTNNGSVNAEDASFVFNGTAAQMLATVSDIECVDVNLSNANGLILAAAGNELKVVGSVTLSNNATLNSNGKLTLLEDIDYSGRVATLPAGTSINGDVKVEKCIQGNIGYTGIGSVHTGIEFEQWDNDLLTTGITNSDYPTYNFNSIYGYDETVAGSLDNGYVSPTNMTDTMNYKKGYLVYVYPQTVGAYGNCYVKLTTVGQLVQQDVDFGITYTSTLDQSNDGWNLINNCYPSTIDWNSTTGWDRNGLNAIHVFDRAANNGLGQYKQYSSGSGQGTNGGTRYIPSGQAFWVKATNASAYLIMNETAKVADFVAITREEVRGKLSLTLMNGQHHTDEAVAFINENATKAFDEDFDTEDMENAGVPSLYFPINDTTKLAIYGSNFADNDTIPVFVKNPVSGQLRIESKNLYAPNTFSCLTLFDAFTNTTIDLNQPNVVYSFMYSDTTTVARFFINARLRDEVSAEMVACKGSNRGSIKVVSPSNELKNYTLTDANGVIVKAEINATSSTINNLPAGTYTLHVADNSYCGGFDTTIVITEPADAVIAQFTLSTDAIELNTNGAAEVAVKNTSIDAVNYAWSINNEVVSTTDAPAFTFTEAGVYQVNLTATNGVCNNSIAKTVTITAAVENNTAVEEAMLAGMHLATTATGYTLSSDKIDFATATITLMDMNGKQVASTISKKQNSIEVNFSGLTQAMYLLQITDITGASSTIKLMAVH